MRYATVSDGPVGPVIKWAGGKTRLLDELVARVPERFGRYFEPFAGGAALFFRLAPARAVLSDANADLIAMYRAVASDPDAVIRFLVKHAALHRQRRDAYYYEVRDEWNARATSETRRLRLPPPRDPRVHAARRAAMFVYLNRTCFNGLYRVNRDGHFNVPAGRPGRGVTPKICIPSAIRAASSALGRAELRCGDYRAAVIDAERGDFVYFDPPYDPVSATSSFTKYTDVDFGADDQRQLADVARDLASKGVRVMLSNNDTPRVRRLYRGFEIARVSCLRSIHADTSRRGAVSEVIITSRPPRGRRGAA